MNTASIRQQLDRPKLQKDWGLANIHQVPVIKRVVVNVGVGSILERDARLKVAEQIADITGQKLVATKAHKSIAGFKIREGNTVGYRCTLRGERMYEFLDKLIQVALPRTRDFRGLKLTSVTAGGTINLGIRDISIFPEVRTDVAKNNQGLQVTVVTTAKDKNMAEKYFRHLGFPLEA